MRAALTEEGESLTVFESNCPKWIDQCEKNIFHQIFLSLHKGSQRCGCQMQIVIVLLECMVERRVRQILRACARDGIEVDG